MSRDCHADPHLHVALSTQAPGADKPMRDSWGHSYLIVRGEILGFMQTYFLHAIVS